jgi:ferric-dicitrate binding protein FerR (iron transport regulator)
MNTNDDDLTDVDPDIVLITAYLAGRLSDFERFGVEKRLEEDEAFFDKVWPLVRAWRAPTKLGALVPQRRSRRHVVRLWPLAAAAVLAITVIETAPRLGIGFTEPPVSLPSIVANGPFNDSNPPIILRSGQVARRLVVLPDSTRIMLQPRSWVAYTHDIGRRAAVAMIGGEATVDVARATGDVTVWTNVGSTSLSRGRYAIRCLAGSVTEMLLTVERGAAILKGIGGGVTEHLVLRAGEFGRVVNGKGPAHADGAGFPAPSQLADSAPIVTRGAH